MPKFVVNRTNDDLVCRVQDVTERPQLGQRFKGPFNTKAEALAEMCANVDASQTDQTKCWQVYPADACSATGTSPDESKVPSGGPKDD